MKPMPVEKSRFQQPRSIMMLDDAEMALTMIDLAQTTDLADSRSSRAVSAPQPSALAPVSSAEFLAEFRSAASLIMDREEIEAMELEIAQILHDHPVAA